MFQSGCVAVLLLVTKQILQQYTFVLHFNHHSSWTDFRARSMAHVTLQQRCKHKHFMKTNVYVWRSVKLTSNTTISMKAGAIPCFDTEKRIVAPVIYISICLQSWCRLFEKMSVFILHTTTIVSGKSWINYLFLCWD